MKVLVEIGEHGDSVPDLQALVLELLGRKPTEEELNLLLALSARLKDWLSESDFNLRRAAEDPKWLATQFEGQWTPLVQALSGQLIKRLPKNLGKAEQDVEVSLRWRKNVIKL